MANNFFKVKKGQNLEPKTGTTVTVQGDLAVNATSNQVEYHNGTTVESVTTNSNTQALTNKTLSGNTATNLVSGAGTLFLNTSGSVTVPNVSDTLIGRATSDVLTNKTLSGNIATNLVSGTGILTLNTTGAVTIPNTTDTLVGKATTDTLTNKTLTTPTINNPTLSGSGGTLTLPAGPDTLVGRATADTLTNKTLTSPVINTPTGIVKGDVGLGNVDNTSDATKNSAVATLTNKTIGDALSLTQVATPSSPSSGFDKLYFKSDDKLYTLNSAGVETAIGAGSGGINYIANPDAESATTGWATYANSAANIPSTGTGGTATGLTFTRSTSSPLRGAASFLIAQANSTSLQGKGVSYDFTINSADQAKMLSISFDYNASSTFVASNGITPPLNDGTTSTNAGNSDIEVFVYDKTNSILVPVSPQVLTANGTNNYSYVGEFQTANNSTSYRLIFHCATTSANATGYTVKFDNVVCGPQTKLLGPPITDWVTYSPTLGGLTASATGIYSRRVGDSLEVQGYIQVNGTSAATASLTLGYNGGNNNVAIDLTKINSGTLIGFACNAAGASVPNGPFSYGIATDNLGATNKVNITWEINGAGLLSPQNGNAAFSSQTYSLFFKVPIAGWSSTTTMSNDTDTRVVALINQNAAPTGTINGGINKVTFPGSSTVKDTHGAYSAPTYTVPVSGFYFVSSSLFLTHTGVTNGESIIFIYQNGVQKIKGEVVQVGTAAAYPTVTGVLNCVAGDTIEIYAQDNNTSPSFSVANPGNYLQIFRLSGPATIAASESVNAAYGLTSVQAVGTNAVVKYDTLIKDTHNAFSTSTGLYTAPIAGQYRLSAQAGCSTTGNVYVKVNGVGKSYLFVMTATNNVNSGSLSYPLKAGDTIGVYFDTAGNASGTATQGFVNYLSIERVGN